MAMSIADLTTEVKGIIGEGLSKGRVMPVYWIVQSVLAKHPVVYDATLIGSKTCDSDYAELARYELARIHVRRVLRAFKKPESDVPKLPGFERLQQGYSIPGDSEDEDDAVIVPTVQLSDDVLLARADEYDRMGDGCHEHADELRRYVRERRRAA